jgi:hypothetical protein
MSKSTPKTPGLHELAELPLPSSSSFGANASPQVSTALMRLEAALARAEEEKRRLIDEEEQRRKAEHEKKFKLQQGAEVTDQELLQLELQMQKTYSQDLEERLAMAERALADEKSKRSIVEAERDALQLENEQLMAACRVHEANERALGEENQRLASLTKEENARLARQLSETEAKANRNVRAIATLEHEKASLKAALEQAEAKVVLAEAIAHQQQLATEEQLLQAQRNQKESARSTEAHKDENDEQTRVLFKKVVEDLRKENDRLRKEKADVEDRLKTALLSTAVTAPIAPPAPPAPAPSPAISVQAPVPTPSLPQQAATISRPDTDELVAFASRNSSRRSSISSTTGGGIGVGGLRIEDLARKAAEELRARAQQSQAATAPNSAASSGMPPRVPNPSLAPSVAPSSSSSSVAPPVSSSSSSSVLASRAETPLVILLSAQQQQQEGASTALVPPVPLPIATVDLSSHSAAAMPHRRPPPAPPAASSAAVTAGLSDGHSTSSSSSFLTAAPAAAGAPPSAPGSAVASRRGSLSYAPLSGASGTADAVLLGSSPAVPPGSATKVVNLGTFSSVAASTSANAAAAPAPSASSLLFSRTLMTLPATGGVGGFSLATVPLPPLPTTSVAPSATTELLSTLRSRLDAENAAMSARLQALREAGERFAASGPLGGIGGQGDVRTTSAPPTPPKA